MSQAIQSARGPKQKNHLEIHIDNQKRHLNRGGVGAPLDEIDSARNFYSGSKYSTTSSQQHQQPRHHKKTSQPTNEQKAGGDAAAITRVNRASKASSTIKGYASARPGIPPATLSTKHLLKEFRLSKKRQSQGGGSFHDSPANCASSRNSSKPSNAQAYSTNAQVPANKPIYPPSSNYPQQQTYHQIGQSQLGGGHRHQPHTKSLSQIEQISARSTYLLSGGGATQELPLRIQRAKFSKTKNLHTKKRTSTGSLMMGSGLMASTQPLNLQNTPSSVDSLGTYEEQAPRIDEMMSSQKRRGVAGPLPEYRLDAAFLLGSRLEIQILKRLKAGFYALGSSSQQAVARGRPQQQSSAYFSRKEDVGQNNASDHGDYDGEENKGFQERRDRLQQTNLELARGISEQIRQYKQAKKVDQERQAKDKESQKGHLDALFSNFNRGKTSSHHYASVIDQTTSAGPLTENTLELTDYPLDRNRQEFIKTFTEAARNGQTLSPKELPMQVHGGDYPYGSGAGGNNGHNHHVYSSTMSFGAQIGQQNKLAQLMAQESTFEAEKMSLRQSAISLNDRSSQNFGDNDHFASAESLPSQQHQDNMGQQRREQQAPQNNMMRLQAFTDDLNSEGNLISINEEDQQDTTEAEAQAAALQQAQYERQLRDNFASTGKHSQNRENQYGIVLAQNYSSTFVQPTRNHLSGATQMMDKDSLYGSSIVNLCSQQYQTNTGRRAREDIGDNNGSVGSSESIGTALPSFRNRDPGPISLNRNVVSEGIEVRRVKTSRAVKDDKSDLISFQAKTRILHAKIALLTTMLKRKDATQARLRCAFDALAKNSREIAPPMKTQEVTTTTKTTRGPYRVFGELVRKVQMRSAFVKLRQRFIFPTVLGNKRKENTVTKRRPNPRYQIDDDSNGTLELAEQTSVHLNENGNVFVSVHSNDDAKRVRRTDNHYLYLQEVMRQRLLVVRKQTLLRWKTAVMRAKQTSMESKVKRGSNTERTDKLIMKKTLRLMQLHLEKNQKEVTMMAFMKLKHFRFNFEPQLCLLSEQSHSPLKMLSPAKTTPRRNKRQTAATTKQKQVAKGTKLPSGFTHYLKVESETAGAPSTKKQQNIGEQSDHTIRTRKAKITSSILSQ